MIRPLMLTLALAAPAAAQTAAQTPAAPAPPAPAEAAALQEALRNYPPLIIGSNTNPVTTPGQDVPKSCPDAGAKVATMGGPTFEYLGTSTKDPALCEMRVDGQPFEAWYGIWGADWPGAEYGRRGIERVMQSKTGDVAGFNVMVDYGPFHDLIRHEGVEDIRILDKTYRALKLAHYREGFDGNTYRSLSTVWKDIPTGILIYGTYQHIAGAPVLDGVLIPEAITAAP